MQASPPLMLGPKHIKLLATRPRRLSCGMIHFITRITRASMPHAGQAETRDSTPGNPPGCTPAPVPRHKSCHPQPEVKFTGIESIPEQGWSVGFPDVPA
eukprot:s1666_g11.t1